MFIFYVNNNKVRYTTFYLYNTTKKECFIPIKTILKLHNLISKL